jgi:hypothetical protein
MFTHSRIAVATRASAIRTASTHPKLINYAWMKKGRDGPAVSPRVTNWSGMPGANLGRATSLAPTDTADRSQPAR